MNRLVLGAVSALLLVAAGLFWWQGRAATERSAPALAPPEMSAAPPDTVDIPDEDGTGLRGMALPSVDPATREQKRFDRLDRDRAGGSPATKCWTRASPHSASSMSITTIC